MAGVGERTEALNGRIWVTFWLPGKRRVLVQALLPKEQVAPGTIGRLEVGFEWMGAWLAGRSCTG